jgi:hypothetical protein
VNFGPATFFHLLNLFGDLSGNVLADNSLIPLFGPEVRQEFRRKYRANKPPRPPREGGRLRIAMHVRRPSAGDAGYFPNVTDVGRMVRTFGLVERVLEAEGIPWEMRLHALGPAEPFAAFARPGVTFFLDDDPGETLADLIDGDIVILSRGSFSYVAGVLSDGIVIADARYPGQDGWIVCDEPGDFDAAALARQLGGRRSISAS